jgi:putative tryptophan/tyrosine transport system substrate-binding protein
VPIAAIFHAQHSRNLIRSISEALCNEAPGLHGRFVACRRDAVGGVGAAAGNAASDSNFPSGNPNFPPYGNGWRERRNPDLIVTGTNPVVIAFRAITRTIPVVAFMLDPLEAGLVTNLARPGGNLTGITLDAGIEIWGKRLETLKEAVPSIDKVAFLCMRDGWDGSSGQFLRDASGRLGITLISMVPTTGTTKEVERVFEAMAQQRPDAVLVSGEGDLYAHRQLIVELAEKNHLPTMCPYRDFVDAGGLMAYTVDLAELLRRMAGDVHQILSGAKPGDIPIYQATKFELLINLRTAKALGLILPPALLSRADEMIE